MARTEDQKQTIRILELLSDDFYAAKIAKKLRVSRPTISKKLKKMAQHGLVKRVGDQPAFYEIQPKGKLLLLKRSNSSAPMMKSRINLRCDPFTDDKIEVHDYAVKIPIVEHGKLASKKVALNNWVKEVLHEDFPIPMTISITTKSAILQFHRAELPRDMRFEKALFEWSLQGIIYAQSYLTRHGFRLHTIGAKVISQHLASRAHDRIAEEIPRENVFRVKFARKAASLTGTMAKNAEAWTDGTPDPRAIESNDLLYEEKMLLMPEKVDRLERVLAPLLIKYGHNVEQHLGVLSSMDSTLAAIRKDLKKRRR